MQSSTPNLETNPCFLASSNIPRETSMRPQALLVTLAALAVLAALPLISNAGSGEEQGWPCCNQCGICNRKMPPECQCLDISYQGCDPACKSCVKYTSADEPPVYRCADMLTNFCERRCTPTTGSAAI